METTCRCIRFTGQIEEGIRRLRDAIKRIHVARLSQCQVTGKEFFCGAQAPHACRARQGVGAKRIKIITDVLISILQNLNSFCGLCPFEFNKQTRLFFGGNAQRVKRCGEGFDFLLSLISKLNTLRLLVHALRHEATHMHLKGRIADSQATLFFQLGDLLISRSQQFFFANTIFTGFGCGLSEGVNQRVHLLLELRHGVRSQALNGVL